MKDDVTDFLFHTALKWNVQRTDFPNTDRNTFFKRHAMNLQWIAKKEVKTIVKAMLEYPNDAAWIFDQHFMILTSGMKPSPDCHPLSDKVDTKFQEGYKKLEHQYG